MNTFLENSTILHNIEQHNINIINIRTFINSILKEHEITLIADGDAIDQLFSKAPSMYTVKAQNGIMDGNLRMVESLMPELLLMLFATDTPILSKAIENLILRKFLFDKQEYRLLYLKSKMFNLLEALFFSDILTSVWHGEWEQKWYVLKEDDTLEYYSMWNFSTLFHKLLDSVSITVTPTKKRKKIHYRLNMKMI